MEKDPPPLTRADFLDEEGWLRHLHEGGLPPWTEGEEGAVYTPPQGSGEYAQRTRALYGSDEEAFRLTWEGYGVTDFLSVEDFVRAYQAVALANCRDRVLDFHLTVSWSTVGITGDREVAAYQGLLVRLINEWFASFNCWPSLLWVLERGDKYGLHTHMLLGTDPVLTHAFWPFLQTVVGRVIAPRVPLRTESSKTSLVVWDRQGGIRKQWATLRYMFKGAARNAGWLTPGSTFRFLRDVAGLQLEYEGEVTVQRMGVSRGLDTEAVAAWRNAVQLPDLELVNARGPQDLYHNRFHEWYRAHWLEVERAERAVASLFTEWTKG